jgi:tight adherence protein C
VELDGTVLLVAALGAVVILALGAALASLRPSLPAALQPTEVSPIAVRLQPLTTASSSVPAESDARSRLRKQLVQAGYRRPGALRAFLVAKATLAIVGPACVFVADAVRLEPLPNAVPLALVATGAGYFLPNLWLASRVADRLRHIERALPDTLDLLVTCVEAGLGLDAAMQRVADETAPAFPILSAELRLAFLEVKAGIPRLDALRRLADRTGAQELRSLSATLAQTELFGTSVSAALRTQAEGIRIRRMQRAEEKAAYISVKMTFPLVLCILPSVFAVLVGPAVVNIAGTLLPLFAGER